MPMETVSNGISTSDKSENISLYLTGSTHSSTCRIKETIMDKLNQYLPLVSARTLDSDLS